MFTKKKTSIIKITSILSVMFALGLVLGSASLFYIPDSILSETMVLFDKNIVLSENFFEAYKDTFIMEFMWLAIIWLIGRMSLISPLIGAVTAIRGFVIGFSVAFVIVGEVDWIQFVLCHIVPQCIFSLPIMSFFGAVCIIYAMEGQHLSKNKNEYLIRGFVFTLINMISSLMETLLMRFFVSYL